MLISKVNLYHRKPLDASHPSLVETLAQNRGIDKNILMPLSIQKRMNLFHEKIIDLMTFLNAVIHIRGPDQLEPASKK